MKQSGYEKIMLSTNLFAKSFSHILDEQLMEHLATLKVPLLLHPRNTEGLPLINENYLDSIFFMAKVFYLGVFDKYFKKTRFILTHTCDSLDYLANPLNLLYYMTADKARLWNYVKDNMIGHDPKGYNYLMNTIVD